MTDKPTSLTQKATLLRALHSRLPSAGRRWLDAVLAISDDDLAYSSLFFSGGNDAKLEMSRPFLANLYNFFLDPARKPLNSSEALQALLHDLAAPVLERQTHGALDPFTVAALNGTSDGDAKYLANPWCYILALEGMLTVAPYHRTLTATAATQEGQDDLLLPLWSEPLTQGQVYDLLEKGSAQAYQRFAVPRRNGRAHFVIPVAPNAMTPFWKRILDWLEDHRRDCSALRRSLDESGTRVLEELGKLRLFDSDVPNIPFDRPPHDPSAEYGLALSLAGLGYGLCETLHARPHMRHFAGRDLCEKLIGLSRSRHRAGTRVRKHPNRAGIVLFNDPYWSCRPAQPRHIQSFIEGRIEEARLGHLLHALCLWPSPPPTSDGVEEASLLPLPYRLAKLAFHQRQGDRRPAPIAILDHLCAQRFQVALDVAHRFLSVRHRNLVPVPSHPWTCDGRRIAAALMFPISECTYDSLLESVQG